MSRRGRLSVEAVTVLSFVSGRRPSRSLVRRYIRAIRRTAHGQPAALPRMAQWWPGALAFFQPVGAAKSPQQAQLKERLSVALALCETAPEGAGRFCDDGRLGRFRVLAAFIGAVAIESVLMPFRLLVTRVLWR